MSSQPSQQGANPALTKAQLIELLQQEVALNKREAQEMVDAFFGLIAEQLIAGKEVKLLGFGNFQVRSKPPRPGRNPRTGDAVDVPAKRVPYFKPGKEIRERLNR